MSRYRIEIENGVATLIKDGNKQQVMPVSRFLGDVYTILRSHEPIEVPENTRFVIDRIDSIVYVIEEPPSRRRTWWFLADLTSNGNLALGLRLVVPRVVYIVVFDKRTRRWDDFKIVAARESLKSIADRVWLLPKFMVNDYEKGKPCMPYPNKELSVLGAVTALIRNFWDSTFYHYASNIHMIPLWRLASLLPLPIASRIVHFGLCRGDPVTLASVIGGAMSGNTGHKTTEMDAMIDVLQRGGSS